mmetsp:Transcript_7160/g.21826  ORF Transcript_7160/g.21826 Transcript_7160/m.21826 type:complete len:95 (+) Transcript_7160:1-285(+)
MISPEKPSSGVLLLDPSAKEEVAAAALLTVAHPFHYDATSSQPDKPVVSDALLACHTEGHCSMDSLQNMLEICHNGANQVAAFSRQFLSLGLRA